MKLEHTVLLTTVTLALVLPFSALGRLSSGRFAPVDTDEARFVIPSGLETSETIETEEAHAANAVGEEIAESAASNEEHSWMFLAGRTLSRLIWFAAENFVVTRDLGRWHAERTGQVESYEVFVASSRRNIRESWEGLQTMLAMLPTLALEDPSQLPMLAGALAVGAIGGVLYPLQSASTLVFGSDEDAGAVAGGFIIDAWMTKAFVGAGLGTRAVKTQSVARMWARFVQKGDGLASAFFPRPRTFAHAHVSASPHAYAPTHAPVPARSPAPVPARTRALDLANNVWAKIRDMDPGSAIARLKIPADVAVRRRNLNRLLGHLDLPDRTMDLLARSDMFYRHAIATVPTTSVTSKAAGLRLLSPPNPTSLLTWPDKPSAQPLDRLATWVTAQSAGRYPLPDMRARPNQSLNEYLRETLPAVVRSTGEGVAGRIEMRRELLRLETPPGLAPPGDLGYRRIARAFTVRPEMAEAYESYLVHGDRKLMQEELGLLWMRRGFEQVGAWERLEHQVTRLTSLYYREQRKLPPLEYSGPAVAGLDPQSAASHLAFIRTYPHEHGPAAPLTTDHVLEQYAAAGVLRQVGLSREMTKIAEASPTLVADIRAVGERRWTRDRAIEDESVLLRDLLNVPRSDEGYDHVAALAVKAGALSRPTRELLHHAMTMQEYVWANVAAERARSGAGILRAFQVRDELLTAHPVDAYQIRRAFERLGADAEAIYREFLRTGDQARAEEALGRLDLARKRAAGEDPEHVLRIEYEERYLERREEMALWGWPNE